MASLLLGLVICFNMAEAAVVGKVTEQTASGSIKRSSSVFDTNTGTGIEMEDLVRTYKGKIGLTFVDDTQVQITANSSLIIDDFVYDPNAKTGKLALNVALGTVRYASGAIAKNSRENVKLKTPSATVTVRGTDFTMTVDETGKSLIILLPSCPPTAQSEADCWVGEIEVATDTGFVILNQAYQATVTTTTLNPPSEPRLLDIDPRNINNMLIINPPREIVRANEDLRGGELDRDLLAYDGLTINELDKDVLTYTDLDINRLDNNFLENVLDALLRQIGLSVDQLENMQDNFNAALPNIKDNTQTTAIVDDLNIRLIRESASHIADVKVDIGANGTVVTNQDGIINNITLNTGGSNVTINIYQSN